MCARAVSYARTAGIRVAALENTICHHEWRDNPCRSILFVNELPLFRLRSIARGKPKHDRRACGFDRKFANGHGFLLCFTLWVNLGTQGSGRVPLTAPGFCHPDDIEK